VTEAAAHPRDAFDLQGAEAAERAWLEAVDRQRLHHAWLLSGPEGVGKATFAYRAARRLLGAAPDASRGLLGTSPDDPVARLVAARAHPDLLVLERGAEDSRSKRAILVDDVRRLPEFFAKSPSVGAWRVAIIDSADDLNESGANAVLKTLEEPPARGVLLLISHAPGRLLPTLRSRCRRLTFAPWPTERIAAFLERRAETDSADAERLAALACGAPGRALRLLRQDALELDEAAGELLDSARTAARAQALADKLRGGEGAERFALLLALLGRRLGAAALAAAPDQPARADRLAELWERLSRLPEEVEALNLDRAEALWTVAADLRAVAA